MAGGAKVNGCRSSRYLDLHHICLRSEGGDHDPDLVITCCGGHHAALHAGRLIVEGRVSTGLRFSHADGTPYGGEISPEIAAAMTEAFLALRGLGFGESESRRALGEVRAQLGVEATPETVVRAALRRLHAKPSESNAAERVPVR